MLKEAQITINKENQEFYFSIITYTLYFKKSAVYLKKFLEIILLIIYL